MSYAIPMVAPRFPMATRRSRPVGRPKKEESERATIRRDFYLTPVESEELDKALPPKGEQAAVLKQLALDWARGNTVSVEDLESYRMAVINEATVQGVTIPHLGTVVNGTLETAIANAPAYTLGHETAGFLKVQAGDISFDCEAQGLAKAGIPEGARVYLRRYGQFGRPAPGDIILVEITQEGQAPTYSLKEFVKSSPFEAKDSEETLLKVPEGATAKAVAELVAYMVSK